MNSITKVINQTMKFELSPKEVLAYEEFIKKLPKRYNDIPKQIIFEMSSGIGTGVIVRVGDKEKNITDYNTW